MFRKLLLALFLFVIVKPVHAVFIGDGSGNLYNLDVSNNTSTLIGNSGVGAMFDIALNPLTNTLYGASASGSLFSINTSTGSASSIGAIGSSVNGLTFDSSGTLYGSGGSSLYTINLGTGLGSLVGNTGFTSSGDLAFDTSGNLYLSAAGATDTLVSLNTATGAGTAIGNTGFSQVYGLNYTNSLLYGFTSGGDTITIDTATGVGSFLATNSINTFGADGVGGVVSEPASIALLGLGLLGLNFARRKKTR